jgi:hypothetical protein
MLGPTPGRIALEKRLTLQMDQLHRAPHAWPENSRHDVRHKASIQLDFKPLDVSAGNGEFSRARGEAGYTELFRPTSDHYSRLTELWKVEVCYLCDTQNCGTMHTRA